MPSSPLTTCWGSTIEKNLVKNTYLLKMDLCLDTWSRCTYCWQAGPLWLCLHRWWVLWRRGWWQSSEQMAAGRWQPVTEWQLLPKPERKQIKYILRCDLQRCKCKKKNASYRNIFRNSCEHPQWWIITFWKQQHRAFAARSSSDGNLGTGYQCYGCMLYWETKTGNPQKDMVS